MLSGSYDGQLFLFKGDGSGKFADPVTLNDPDDKTLLLDQATSVSLFDWSKDGKPDLFVGTISGPVWYLPNLGGGKVGPATKLSSPDGPMDQPDGGPAAFDWDGDGIMDLFVGQDSGQMLFYKGRKSATKPEFEKPIEILAELTAVESDAQRALEGDVLEWDLKRPRMRPKPSVADWNGDGKLDLLVGDMCMLEGSLKHLNAEQLKEFKALRVEQDKLREEGAKRGAALQKRIYAEMGWPSKKKLTPEEASKYTEEYDKLYKMDDAWLKLDDRLVKIYEQMSPLMPEIEYHGFVWVFLRK